MKSTKFTDKKSLLKAVSGSSKLEGLSLARAKKNEKIIHYFKGHGRAFAL